MRVLALLFTVVAYGSNVTLAPDAGEGGGGAPEALALSVSSHVASERRERPTHYYASRHKREKPPWSLHRLSDDDHVSHLPRGSTPGGDAERRRLVLPSTLV